MFANRARHWALRLAASVGIALFTVAIPDVAIGGERLSDGQDASRQTVVGREQAAEEQYELGVEAFRQKRYAEAIDNFNRANTLRPDSRLYFNIGLAFDRAGDVSNALSNYRTYVFEERGSEHTERVAARVSELEKELAKLGVQQVTIRSTPNLAQVTIDGQSVGVTPWTGDLQPGFYRVTLTREGFETARLEFSLSLEAALTLSSTLHRLSGAPSDSPFVVANATSSDSSANNVRSAAPDSFSLDKDATNEAEGSASGTKILPWVAVGTGAALGLGALGFELDRRDAVSDARTATSRSVFHENVTRMQRDQTLARVFGTVAVTGVVVGVIWLLVPDDTLDEDMNDRTSYACDSAGCNWELRF